MSTIKLYNGDCLKLLRDVPDGSVDCVITDPPYGISYQSHRGKEKYEYIRNDDNLDFLPCLMKELHRVLKENTHIYMFCVFGKIDIIKMEFERYFSLRNILIWNKSNFGIGNYYRYKYEMVLFGEKGKRPINSHSFGDVIDFGGTGNPYHPTQKPVGLLEIFINNSTDGGLVLDPFMGSGSTGIACKKLNRDFIGIEISENYFKIAKERIENTTTKLF